MKIKKRPKNLMQKKQKGESYYQDVVDGQKVDGAFSVVQVTNVQLKHSCHFVLDCLNLTRFDNDVLGSSYHRATTIMPLQSGRRG